MTTMTMPTATAHAAQPRAHAASNAPTLRDLLEDGIYLLFLLRNGNAPQTVSEFNKRIESFLAQFDKLARNLGKSAESISDAKYAFCALMDEIILSSNFSIREDWERAPLQLRLFGEHLAGENFFEKLDQLRNAPAQNIELLEVFHTCLLLGFQGRYLLEGPEKLSYLINRLHQEILHVRGGKPEFAPNWKLPHRFQQYVRHELPLWLFFALLAVVGAGVFGVYTLLLKSDMDSLRNQQRTPAIHAPLDMPGKPERSL